jgi:CBS domain containing-hemolysin-like protein
MISTLSAFFITIIASAIHSAWEMAVASLSKAEVKSACKNKVFGSCALNKVMNDKESFISTNTICNNIANIMGSGVVGTNAGLWLGSEYVGLVMGILTFTIIICSEIIPKAYGTNNPLFVGRIFAPVMVLLSWVLTPINWMIGKLTARFKSSEPSAIVEKIYEGTYNLSLTTVEQVGTPRVNMTTVRSDERLEDIKPSLFESQHSRLVVLGKSRDDVQGIMLLKDAFQSLAKDENPTVQELTRTVLKVESNITCEEMFKQFTTSKTHLAVMVDDFGGTDGVVSLEDIMELMTQTEIQDETDEQVCMREVG